MYETVISKLIFEKRLKKLYMDTATAYIST